MDIYDELATVKIGDDNATAIQQQMRGTNLAESQVSRLESIKLVNDATLRSDGGPIPDTQKIHEGPSVTDGTRTVVFTPSQGESWSVMNITCQFVNIVGSTGVTLYLYDIKNDILQTFFYGTSSSTDFMLDDDGTWDDFIIGYPCQLQFNVNGSSYDSAKLQLNMVRLR